MKEKYGLKIDLFGIGSDAYWPQFKNLKECPDEYLGELSKTANNIFECF